MQDQTTTRWYHFIAWFFGGVFLANTIPHLVSGISGSPFQSPFASPPGEGLSSAMVNVLWGFFNLVVAYVLVARVGRFDLRQTKHVVVLGLGILALALMAAWTFGRFHGGNVSPISSDGRTWVSITENGDKVGVGLVLTEKAGKATSGKLYVLDPIYPRDLSKGVGYDLSNVRQEGQTITADVSVVDYSSKPSTKEMHLRILLKGGFDGKRVLAEMLPEGGDTKLPIVFEREKGK
jgi:hypothetical protein